ncbi:hypothetical protein [Gimesia algae]|uniref:Uncharacterized protein n=1 Tax=Gimesia algae TaxID=2527971 RepID=A0A517VHD1_9PLAN|nr:hypothetical protein [Gimesia algae]QDT92419.1 hypothetical protein Pan161_40860 [Gimesia algae]
MAVYYLLSILAVFAPGEADLSVDELFTIYQQNRESFVAMELDCFYHWSHSEELAISIDAEIENLRIQLKRDDLPGEVIRQIKANASPNASFEKAKLEFIAHREMLRKLELRAILQYEHIFYRMTPELWDLHLYLHENMKDPREKSAISRDLTSFTGGNFQHVQRKIEGEWLCLEPYPFVNRTSPVANSKTIWDTRHSPLPLFFESGLLKSESTTHWNTFWDEPEKIKTFGNWSPKTGGPLQLLIKPIDDMQFQFVALDVAQGAMPRWCATMCCIDNRRVDDLTPEMAANLAGQIAFFQNHSTTDVRYAAVPLTIIYYEDYQKYDSAGWYPLRITHKNLALHSTAETVRKKRDWRQTPFGIGSIRTLQIKSIAVNDSVTKPESLKLPANTIILDLDTENNTNSDDTPVKVTDRFMSRLIGARRWNSLKVNAVIILGILTIFTLFGFLVWKRLTKPPIQASELQTDDCRAG